MNELTAAHVNIIGPKCESAGITISWLKNSAAQVQSVITNGMALELNKYKQSSSDITWSQMTMFWPRLCPNTVTPSCGYVRDKFHKLPAKRESMRKKGKKKLSEWLNAPFDVPRPPAKDVNQRPEETECQDTPPPQHIQQQPVETESESSEDEEWIPPLTPEGWEEHERLQLEYNNYLEQALEKTQRNMSDLAKEMQKAEMSRTRCEALKDRFKEEASDLRSECSRLKKQLTTVENHCEELKGKLSHLKPKNFQKRIKNREHENTKLKEEIVVLKEKVMGMSKCNDDVQRQKHRLQDKLRRLDKKISDCKEGSQKIKDLQKEIRQKNKTLSEMEQIVDEIMEKEEQVISTFENGRYNNDIRLTVYELLSMGVGSKKVADIMRTVLQRVGKLKVGRLPKPTIVKYMATEQGLLAKQAAFDSIRNSEHVTLHLDGTTKKRKHFITYLSTTSSGTVAMGLDDIYSETAEELLQKTEECLEGLTQILPSELAPDKHEEILKMLMNVKNVMTDRAAVNKAFVKKFADWRAEVLPKLVPQWEELNEEIKEQLKEINDIYCGKHLVLNLQEYAQSALYEWEEVETNSGKLGREKHILWNRGKESATMLAVRSICLCFGPDADPQSGHSFEFSVHLEDVYEDRSRLQEFRGNRFNIPFENATAAYYHLPHLKTLIHSYPEAERNRLMKSCLWDIEDNVIIGGMRAMGLLERQLTSPIMQMLDSSIHVMDTSAYYQRAFDKIKQIMVDPTEVMHGQLTLFANFPPVKDKLWDSLFRPVTEEVEDMTRQALIIIAHSLGLCMERQLKDHLEGGKFHTACQRVRMETEHCPKHNLAPEWLFSQLDRKQREMPHANTITIEGIIMWSQNKTLAYLDSLDDKKEELIDKAVISRKKALELYRKKREDIRKRKAKKLRDMERKTKEKEVKKMEDIRKCTAKVNEYKLCDRSEDIKQLVKLVTEKHKESPKEVKDKEILEAVKSQIRFYKTVNFSSKIDYKLFHFSHGKTQLSLEELQNNLQEIIKYYEKDNVEEAGTSTTCSQVDDKTLKEEKLNALKRKYTFCGVSPTKQRKRDDFPGEELLNKRISLKFKTSSGKRHHFYKGVVLRKSTYADLEEFMEEEDRNFVGKFDFYTVQFDPPHDDALYTYPLEKEWLADCLNII